MNTNARYSHLAVSLILAVGLWGCTSSEEARRSPAPAPPPPPDEPQVQRTYDYPHTAEQTRRQGLRRKLVVALVRFAEDQPVEDVPFGPKPEDEQPEDATATVELNVEIGGDAPSANPPTVARPGALGQRSRHMLKRELLESDAFVVVERDGILDILRELQFGQSEYVNPETTPGLGEIMSVQYLLEGSIGRNEDRSFKETVDAVPDYEDRGPSLVERILNPDRASMRTRLRELHRLRVRKARLQQLQREYPYGVYLSLYNVRTSELAAEALGIGGTRQEAIMDAVEELVDECLDIPQPPRVAWVDEDRVFVDLGEDDDVEIGQRYRYVSLGSTIRNSAGQIIGRDEQEGGVIEITRVEPLMSVGTVVVRVTDPAVGDRVELAE